MVLGLVCFQFHTVNMLQAHRSYASIIQKVVLNYNFSEWK